MLSFLILLFSFSFSGETPSKKLTYIESSTNHLLSNAGFYDILVRGGETITGILSNGDYKLFIVVPSHPNISIEEINIDGIPVSEFSEKKGFAINGRSNVTFKIYSSDSKIIHHVNAWLIPSKYCSNAAMYAYGSHKIKYQSSLSIQDFCIFSPTLDSKNNDFIVDFGLNNTSKQTYNSELFRLDFDSPQQSTTGDQLVNYESDGPYYIQFNFDSDSNNETIIYERRTKTISFKDKENKCTINPFYRCSVIDNAITCNDDYIGEINSKLCSGLTISGMTLGLIITFGVLAILSFIAGIVLCSCCCDCCACCCCNRHHKSSKKDTKAD
ncbi:hypothetical protein M9Y10_023972 [Tritrichomonas musculus]|uniref:Uncharacterized protein n=1 Tax=Tritrichomonas musculus TaxID=1915356 RepID=A0ABR2KZS1_9EUKA